MISIRLCILVHVVACHDGLLIRDDVSSVCLSTEA